VTPIFVRRKYAILAASILACAIAANVAHAQTYPQRPITFVVPSSAGGPGDAAARLIANHMSASLGQQIVVDNVPGAGGTLGMTRAARAAPDGYTLMIHQNGFAITPSLYTKLSFDTAKDFVTVGLVNRSNVYLVGRKSLPASNFAELVAWMKRPGNSARVAHPGIGTVGHLQTVILIRAMGAAANLIPYRGVAPAVNDLVGEHIDAVQVGAAVASPLIRSGAIKAYASTASKRDAAFPDIPVYREVGHAELERPFWHALFAPAGTPQSVIDRLNAALQAALADPQMQKAYADSGVEAFPREQWSVAAANDYVRSEIDYWGKVVRDNNIKVAP
jgi:tripartite-type tricarboxylate transporter receptor subunit TctC